MELDSMKQIWHEAGEQQVTVPARSEIMQMLGKSSRSPVARMVHNVLAEALFMVVLFWGVAIYYFIAFHGQFNSVSWLYIITSALSVIYYYRKWKLLHEIQCLACQVKSNLQKQVKTLEAYVQFYLVAGTLIVPILFILLGIFFYYKFPQGSYIFFFPPIHQMAVNPQVAWVVWFISIAVITFLTYRANQWYVNRLYGRHIRQLKLILNQLNEE